MEPQALKYPYLKVLKLLAFWTIGTIGTVGTLGTVDPLDRHQWQQWCRKYQCFLNPGATLPDVPVAEGLQIIFFDIVSTICAIVTIATLGCGSAIMPAALPRRHRLVTPFLDHLSVINKIRLQQSWAASLRNQ